MFNSHTMSQIPPSLYEEIKSVIQEEGYTVKSDFKDCGIRWVQCVNGSMFEGYEIELNLGFKKDQTFFSELAQEHVIVQFSTFGDWKAYHDKSLTMYPLYPYSE